MTHADKDKYFKKHPDGSKVDDELKQEIISQVKNNNISCKKAEEIAVEIGFTLEETGKAIDILNINITKCQLGLFGYGETKKIVQPAKEVTPELKEKITSALKDGKLSCASAWEIAKKLDVARMKVCAACEAMEIKIKPCQLGAF
ncbi:MAG: hypothetical protein NTW65_01085 [Deltaproteobacteria bacterium]|nr:hypothetical protein [Deltaproteobacteria bacterium]